MAKKKDEKSKREQKEKLNADVEAFLKQGGKIEKLLSAREQAEKDRKENKLKMPVADRFN